MSNNLQAAAPAFSEVFVRLREVADAAWEAERVAWAELDSTHKSTASWLEVRKAAFKAQQDFDAEVTRYRATAGFD